MCKFDIGSYLIQLTFTQCYTMICVSWNLNPIWRKFKVTDLVCVDGLVMQHKRGTRKCHPDAIFHCRGGRCKQAGSELQVHGGSENLVVTWFYYQQHLFASRRSLPSFTFSCNWFRTISPVLRLFHAQIKEVHYNCWWKARKWNRRMEQLRQFSSGDI